MLEGKVSIHAPAWGATTVRSVAGPGRAVSIHAPAWGATQGADPLKLVYRVSIHAPAWGATRRKQKIIPWNAGFNPRPRVGGDSLFLC